MRTLLVILMLVPLPASAVRFRLPFDDPAGEYVLAGLVVGCDHDPALRGGSGASCLAFDGQQDFPFCYDGHTGSDYLLASGFAAMDEDLVQIVAAAEGVVAKTRDGYYDRCHGELQSLNVDCDGHEEKSNFVAVVHADGTRTEYHHMKKGSVLVAEGDEVDCGQPLGLVGSSGHSSTPHLHFRVEDATGAWLDPYAGPHSQPTSWWVQQDSGNGLPGAECEAAPLPPAEPVSAAEPSEPVVQPEEAERQPEATLTAEPPPASGPDSDATVPTKPLLAAPGGCQGGAGPSASWAVLLGVLLLCGVIRRGVAPGGLGCR